MEAAPTTAPAWQQVDEPDAHAPVYEGEPEAAPEVPNEELPGPKVEAYATTITVTLAHGADRPPQSVIEDVAGALENLKLEGVVVGVSSVELRGPGGLIGL